MDVMDARRRLLMMQNAMLDTSPNILTYNMQYVAGGGTVVTQGFCITDKYYYNELKSQGTIAYNGMNGKAAPIYRINGTSYMDYWVLSEALSPRKCLNTYSDAIAFTLNMSTLDECYAYLVDTGQIFFAGKNTPYYGHKNISELN